MTKEEIQKNKEIARLYYMSGEAQRTISEKVGISTTTLSKWVEEGGWKVMKAARTITRQELITKMLKSASDKLDEGQLSADEMVKIASAIEKIDKKTNIVTVYEVFNIYNRWLESRMKLDPNLTPDLIRVITKYQDLYLADITSNTEILQ